MRKQDRSGGGSISHRSSVLQCADEGRRWMPVSFLCESLDEKKRDMLTNIYYLGDRTSRFSMSLNRGKQEESTNTYYMRARSIR